MKKYISLFFAALMLFSCIIPFSAFAAESTEDDAYFTQTEFEAHRTDNRQKTYHR